MKIYFTKTVLLFASIHLLIACVAGRQVKKKNKKADVSSVALRGGEQHTVKAKTAMLARFSSFENGRP